MKSITKHFLITCLLFAHPFGFLQAQNPPIYIAFLWHMHQPIYYPNENVVTTHQLGRYPFSLWDIFQSRTGPYTSWPKDAVQMGINANMPHFGAQVSFSGSLIENLNNWESAGWGFQNWKSSWNTIKNQNTSLGHPRIDIVGFGYHHPLMGLIDYKDIRAQIQRHKSKMQQNFPGAYSKGIFPPENAFSEKMIPALKDEGLDWVLVDNIHFDRACQNYPFNTSGNIYEANKADVQNPNPNDWVQLNNIWAPTQNSALWGRQPHYIQYTDPNSGQNSQIIAVPTDRYLGNQDGQGGFGALSYDLVMSQLESHNTDPNHPMLIVLHHDGDNYGGGSPSYYQNNFQAFVSWLQSNSSRFVCTTVEDYLQMFPPSTSDVIHVENGSWSGADNGDPEFKKWNADPNNCVSFDRNSWAVVTAAKNFVETAKQIAPTNTNISLAEGLLLNAEASDYWYWDGSSNGIWDAHPTRACNLAIQTLQPIISGTQDLTAPTIWATQREPYNPGANEWNQQKSSDFTVWSFAFDVNGIQNISLKYRTDMDGTNPIPSVQNETYLGGNEVSTWASINMTDAYINPSTQGIAPLYKAHEFSAKISGLSNVLVDYYIEANDNQGNVAKSEIEHVWVGSANTLSATWANCDTSITGGNGGGTVTPGVSWLPFQPTSQDTITITVGGATQGAQLHWGVNSWLLPNAIYRPSGSTLWGGTGPAVESPMSGPANNAIKIKLGPFNSTQQVVNKVDFVIHYNDNTWDNNNSQDYHIFITQSTDIQDDKLGIITLYPNPAEKLFFVEFANLPQNKTQIRLVNLLGEVVLEKAVSNQKEAIATDTLTKGIYFIEIENGEKIVREKIIVQ